MILSDIKKYLVMHRRVVLADLVNHFDVEPDAMRGMVDHWIRKGRVRKLQAASACGATCCKCDPTLTELYEWVN